MPFISEEHFKYAKQKYIRLKFLNLVEFFYKMLIFYQIQYYRQNKIVIMLVNCHLVHTTPHPKWNVFTAQI